MKPLLRDPLLAIAKGILIFLMVCVGIGIAVCAIAIPALAIWHRPIMAGMDLPATVIPYFIPAAIALLVTAIALLAMVWKMFQLLRRIVDTVGQGDPFVPENASRLTIMAWLSLGIQLVTLPAMGIGMWFARVMGDAVHDSDLHVDGGISANGLLLMLILFILARVFRQGAAMRAELEDTV